MRRAHSGMVWLNGLTNNDMDSVYSLKGPAICEIMERFVSRIPRTEREYSHFPLFIALQSVQPLYILF
jgi:hypothetical protein